MLDSRPLSGERFRNPFEIFLVIRIQRADDGIAIAHDVRRDMSKIRRAQRIFRVHNPQVLIDTTEGLPAEPAEARQSAELISSWEALGRNDRSKSMRRNTDASD